MICSKSVAAERARSMRMGRIRSAGHPGSSHWEGRRPAYAERRLQHSGQGRLADAAHSVEDEHVVVSFAIEDSRVQRADLGRLGWMSMGAACLE
jgi:hypothetical protein